MKKVKSAIAAAAILAGAGGYKTFHVGGVFHPYIIDVTQAQLDGIETEDWRYCTFKAPSSFPMQKNDYFSLFFPGSKEVKFQVPKDLVIENVFLKCKLGELDLGKAATLDNEKLIELCNVEAKDCKAEDVPDAKAYINKLVKHKS